MAKFATLAALMLAAQDAAQHGAQSNDPLTRMMLPYVRRAQQQEIPRNSEEWRNRPETVAHTALELFKEDSNVIV